MGIEKHSERKRKGITVALRVVLVFRNSGLNNSSSPWTTISSSFTGRFCVCSYFKSLLAVVSFAKSPTLLPILYKFIVLGSYPNSFDLGLQIVTLQLALSVGKACTLGLYNG